MLSSNKVIVVWHPGANLKSQHGTWLARLRCKGVRVLIVSPDRCQGIDMGYNDDADFFYEYEARNILDICLWIVFGASRPSGMKGDCLLLPHAMSYQCYKPMVSSIEEVAAVQIMANMSSFASYFAATCIPDPFRHRKGVEYSDFEGVFHSDFYTHGSNCSYVIPVGYPKLDSMIDSDNLDRESKNLVLLCPSISSADGYFMVSYGVDVIRFILDGFPDCSLYYRPHPADYNNIEVCEIKKIFSANRRFIYGAGTRQDKYYKKGLVMITDSSATAKTFSFSMLRTSIHFRPDLNNVDKSILNKGAFVYVSDLERLKSEITRIKLSGVLVKSKIKKIRDNSFCNVGCSEDVLVSSIEKIIDGQPDDGWIKVGLFSNNKKITPDSLLSGLDFIVSKKRPGIFFNLVIDVWRFFRSRYKESEVNEGLYKKIFYYYFDSSIKSGVVRKFSLIIALDWLRVSLSNDAIVCCFSVMKMMKCRGFIV